jgi:hypothetical protein
MRAEFMTPDVTNETSSGSPDKTDSHIDSQFRKGRCCTLHSVTHYENPGRIVPLSLPLCPKPIPPLQVSLMGT